MTFMIQNKKHYAYRLSEAIWEEANRVKKERSPKNEMRRLAETYEDRTNNDIIIK